MARVKKASLAPDQAIRDNTEYIEKAYQRLFATHDGQIVLEDLARGAFVDDSTYGGDRDTMLINEGCRRCFLNICKKIRLHWTKRYTAADQIPRTNLHP